MTGTAIPRLARANEKQACVAAYEETQALRKQGKLRLASERVLACARNACPAFVKSDCAAWLGEIEASLYRHPLIKEAAVVALPDADAGVRIRAFLSCRETTRPSLIELKRFCSENLPLYMVPDHFTWLDALPKTSTDKVDYQGLKGLS